VFWWRKRNEGFEWRDYVRTTILVRREQRRQKLKDVQAAAAAHVKDAGKRGLEASVSGARTAGSGAWHGLKTAASTLAGLTLRAATATGSALVATAAWLASAMSTLAQRIGEPLGPLLDPALAYVQELRPNLTLKIIAILTGFGAAYRTWAFGFDGDAIVATVISAVTAVLVLLAHLTDPRRSRRPDARENLLNRLRSTEFAFPGRQRFSVRTASVAALGLIALATGVTLISQYATPLLVAGGSSAPATTGALPDPDPSKLEGRATALSGDSLRIGGTLVALDGIEAPEPTQSCQRKSGKWRCGLAAKEALADLVRGRRISCEIVDEDDSGARARCYTGEDDIAQKLVRKGNVFSNGGFLSRYAEAEDDAQSEKIGLWAGDAERPQDYRDKRWEEAKRTAPDGCPIKGRIRSGSRTYVLPWSESYDSVQLRTSRGERWFCSESEAQAAGWSPASRS